MPRTVCVPISADLYNEFILRTGKSEDVAAWIEGIVENFLDDTKDDHPAWSEEYYEHLADQEADETLATYGLPGKGYHWQSVFLPNGTRLRMTYRGLEHFAEVRHQQIIYEGESCSPSEFASRVASNTSRNAWRDIWMRRPTDNEWVFADALRRQQ
ncbi:MAG: hypothetical protein OEY97_08480 [Nitrospirota bacterium]|nr:hypothetical protein [Nitrospirota bacterium]